MANGPSTLLADVIVPSIFTPYVQQQTTLLSELVQSGALVADPYLDSLLAGGGKTFDVPSFKPLDNDSDNVATDAADDSFTAGTANSTPKKTGTSQETAVRLSRNQSWSSNDLTAALAGADPMNSIADQVATYWRNRLQAAFLATMAGIFADNDAAPSGSDTHTTGDMTNDISGGSFVDGVTNFSAESFLDAALTMGDNMNALGLVMVHSVVYNRMQKNNLIDFIPDATGQVNIPTFLGRRVIMDDSMPASGGVYQTFLFGAGAVRLGVGAPKTPTEVDRKPAAGNGSGEDVLYNRTEWIIHPTGNRYIGTSPAGGPSNANSSNNLAAAGSWSRTWPQRKQIKIARLITRES